MCAPGDRRVIAWPAKGRGGNEIGTPTAANVPRVSPDVGRTELGTPFTPSLGWRIADFLVSNGVYIALIGTFAAFSMLYPDRFLTRVNLAQGIGDAVAVTLVLGVAMTIGLACGQIDVSGGALMSLLSLTFVVLLVHTNRDNQLFPGRVSIPVAVLVVLAIAGATAVLIGVLVVDFGIMSLLASFPVALLVYGIGGVLGNPHGTNYYLLPKTRAWNFVYYANHQILGIPFAVYLAAVVAIVGWVVLERTRFGAHLQAVGGGPNAALRAGIPVTRIWRSAFFITTFGAVLATYLTVGATETGGPDIGVAVGGSGPSSLGGASLDAFTAVLIGGASIKGGGARVERTVVGCLLVAVVSDGLRMTGLSIYIQGIVTGALFIIAIAISSLASRLQRR